MRRDGPPGDGRVGDDEAHLAALLAVLTLARADAPPHRVPHADSHRDPERTPLQQWRARRLAALSADDSTRPPRSALPRPGQRR